ncbi:MAG: hypothetical protein ABSE16_02945 [Verrucomicrobiota bacterium]|jgi:hypothetical protein
MKHTTLRRLFLALAAGLVLATLPAQAQTTNTLLVNPIFQASSGNSVPPGWTYFAPPTATAKNYWVVNQATANDGGLVQPISGTTNWWKQWNELYSTTVSNVAGIYQTFSSSPGSIYQADGWLITSPDDTLGSDCYAWIQVEFLNSNSNLLALYKSSLFNASVGTASGANWFLYQVTNACDLTQQIATGDPSFPTYAVTGAVSQLVAPLQTTLVRYRYCVFAAGAEGGSVYFSDAALDEVSGPIPPVISDLNPQNEIFVPPANGLSFDVSSPSGFTINSSSIQLILNGTNVSAGLIISGSSSNKTVLYDGLQSNSTYNASITAMDSFNLTANANTYFQTTWVGVPAYSYLWLAVDWDFNGGMYIDNPDLCNAPGDSSCYFGQVGVQNVDEYSSGTPPAQYYRGAADGIGTEPSGDYSRPNLFAAGRIDYCINPFNGDPAFDSTCEWVNYTRDWPNSTNWIIGRFANGAIASGSIEMSLVNPGVSTNVVGTFTMSPGPSWSTFEFVYLQGTNGDGQNATVVLNGVETLRATSGGNMLPTFYMLVPAETDLPFLSNLYPTGKHPFEYTNTLSFTVTSLGATFPPNGIQEILDGNDVSSNLVITGPASSNNVVYPTLPPNEMHTVIINVTNSLGHGISLTNQFDTFTQSNYMFQAPDFDYNGGQYVSAAAWYPDCYASYVSFTNVDFHHTINTGEPTDGSDYQYRQNGIPQQIADDYLLTIFANYFAPDYQLYWFGPADWANYTRAYPTGSFNIYARSSGLGAYAMTLGQVVSGAGTTNQVVAPLGQWSAVGVNINTFGWVPLTDAGLVAPVTVKLGGVTTLQVSTPTGDAYPNYFMLVPTSAIHLSAARSGNNVNLSFPSQAGFKYRVFYKNSLTAGSWSLLNSVLGDGTVKSVTDSLSAGNQRFYQVTSP